MRISELAERLGGSVHWSTGCADDVEISAMAPIDRAQAGHATFIANPEYAKFAATTRASVIIVGKVIDEIAPAQIVVRDPYYGFARAAQMFHKENHGPKGISPKASVSSSATIGADVTIHPFVVIDDDAVIGDRVVLYPGCCIGRGVHIGEDSVLRANVVVEHGCRVGKRAIVHGGCVIGADGFGFAPGEGGIAKIPQTGIVVIGDDVELGAHVSIDRAALGETRIGNGCKLDDKVHIAHNVVVGDHCMFSGQSGVAGSTRIGSRVVVGGHTAINGHISIADDVMIGGFAGVTKSIKEKGVYMGFPAMPAGQWRRKEVIVRRLLEK